MILKTYLLIFLSILICSTTSLAQKNVSAEILKAKVANKVFQKIDNIILEKKTYNPINSLQFATYYQYNLNAFKKLNDDDIEYLSMPIQTTDGKFWLLDLKKTIRKNIKAASTGKNYGFFNNKNKRSYIGVIRGKEKESLACLIFTNEEIKGFISLNGEGVFEIGKLKNSDTHIIYNAHELEDQTPDLLCDADENKIVYHSKSKAINNKRVSLRPEERPCIGIQAVVDYTIFTGAGNNDLPTTINYIEDFYTQVFAIFFNEGINMNLNDIYVHTTEQSYTSPLGFVANDESYTRAGDLIQFLRPTVYGGRAGAASTGSICGTYGYSWSKLNGTFGEYPTFYSDIKTAAHELGHNLGAPHLFSCAWNNNIDYQSGDNNPGGSERITNCNASGSSCADYPGSSPYTVMGYCGRYLTFTPQAGDLMRMTIDSCTENINRGCIDVILSSNKNYAKQKEEIIIYPNPVSKNLKIKGISNIDEILLKDLTGKTIKKVTNKSELNIGELSSGIYILKIKSDDKISIKRIIKN